MKLTAEYVDYMGLYRLYNPKNPSQTVAYEENLEDAKRHSLENGYDGIIIKSPSLTGNAEGLKI